MFSNDTFSLCVINPAKPPAKVSPAVGSKPLPMAKLVQRKPEDHETVKHRVPLLITTYFGPIAWILAAALTNNILQKVVLLPHH
jgi:hypothetical protein